MKNRASTLLIILISFFVSACEFEIKEEETDSTSNEKFTVSELNSFVMYDTSLLNERNEGVNREGFVVMFKNTANLDLINLEDTLNEDATFGSSKWSIENDKLQITYPNDSICTTTKTSATDSIKYSATAACENGTPSNEIIKNSFNKSLPLDTAEFSGLTIEINNESNDKYSQTIAFSTNLTFSITNIDSGESPQTGTFKNSTFKNVVELNNASKGELSYLILLENGLSTGLIIHSIFDSTTMKPTETQIFKILPNNKWVSDSLFETFSLDEIPE